MEKLHLLPRVGPNVDDDGEGATGGGSKTHCVFCRTCVPRHADPESVPRGPAGPVMGPQPWGRSPLGLTQASMHWQALSDPGTGHVSSTPRPRPVSARLLWPRLPDGHCSALPCPLHPAPGHQLLPDHPPHAPPQPRVCILWAPGSALAPLPHGRRDPGPSLPTARSLTLARPQQGGHTMDTQTGTVAPNLACPSSFGTRRAPTLWGDLAWR